MSKVQRCSECDAPTGRCEDDAIYADARGPLCEDCAESAELREAMRASVAEINRLRASLATARREALEEAARALDSVPVVSQNGEVALHNARHAIRALKEEPQP